MPQASVPHSFGFKWHYGFEVAHPRIIFVNPEWHIKGTTKTKHKISEGDKTLNISTQLANAILSYMMKKPYQETAQLIGQIQKEISEQQTPDNKVTELKEVNK